jgi:hypothetical protein
VDVAGARVHLDASSQLEIAAIDQGQVRLAVQQGAAYLHVYPGVSGVNFQIDTAHGAAYISQPGQYEIIAGDDQNPASLSVIEGQAQFVGQNTSLALQAGQRGNITPDNQSSVDAAQLDDFVRMVQQQEQPYQQQVAQTAQYVSPQQTGYQDLARYGQWDQAPEYGAVWYPQAVPANWAPYRYGHWAYVAPWGWTWVDDAPWGFTPFHYGRWVQVGPRWGWIPGARVARPVYAPALVSFFDLGGVGINLSLGWVPLGPNEVYVPYYRHSPRYVRAVNITNVHNETTIINVVNKKTVINHNKYVNYRGATSASRDVMAGGRPVGQAWNKNGKAKLDQQWAKAKPEQEIAFRPSQPETPAPQAPSDKNWSKTGKPNNNGANPKNNGPEPYLPPVNGASMRFEAPSGKPQGAMPAVNGPAEPQSSKNKKRYPQPPAIAPAAASKPAVPQQNQLEQPASKRSQWKVQQQKPQAEPQFVPRQNQSKQQWKQQGQPSKPRAEKAPDGGQAQQNQRKKPAQNCGQQGACQQ